MTWILGGMAILCLIYYVVIIIYSGIGVSFSAVWLLAAGSFLLMAAGYEYLIRHPKAVPLWLPVSTVTFCLAGLVIFCVVEFLIFAGAVSGPAPDLDYLIVLGARVRRDQIGVSLKKRLDKAIEYVEMNPDTILVLSGGQGDDEPMAEAKAMYDYLQFNGVKPEQMILETRSHSTVENIAYSRVAIEEDQKKKGGPTADGPRFVADMDKAKEEKEVRIGVLTSDFHVFRAKQIARKWGIPKIYGIGCDTDPVMFLHYCVRECAAVLKDRLMGNM